MSQPTARARRDSVGHTAPVALAAELHDSALQLVLAAGQDLDAYMGGDDEALQHARTSVARAAYELRALIGRAQDPGSAPAPSVASLEADLADAARRGGFTADLELAPEAQAAHPLLTSQLAREFVNNAAKHARARRVRVRLIVDPPYARLTVSDDGRGMPTTRTAEPGHHLGLALSRERVRAAGGTLRIASIPGAGTTITAELPLDRDELRIVAAS